VSHFSDYLVRNTTKPFNRKPPHHCSPLFTSGDAAPGDRLVTARAMTPRQRERGGWSRSAPSCSPESSRLAVELRRGRLTVTTAADREAPAVLAGLEPRSGDPRQLGLFDADPTAARSSRKSAESHSGAIGAGLDDGPTAPGLDVEPAVSMLDRQAPATVQATATQDVRLDVAANDAERLAEAASSPSNLLERAPGESEAGPRCVGVPWAGLASEGRDR
jgi:hypothetical protein